jgi:two-component system cell cycle sensor histidine kinase/response regulator CckA
MPVKLSLTKEEFFYDKDGNKRWQLTSKLPLRNDKGEIIGLVGVSTDITERKKMEEMLRESEERYRSIFENTTIGIYRTTPDGRFLFANPAMVKLLGFNSFEELSKYNIEEDGHYMADYPRSKFRQLVEENGQISGLETRKIRDDGSVFWVRENSRVVYDENHNVAYYEGTLEDISGSKRVEEELEKERTLLKTLIEHLPYSVFVKDREYRKTVANQRHLRVIAEETKRPLNEIEKVVLGKTDFDVYPKEVAEQYFLDDQKVIRDGEAIIDRVESRISSDGKKRWVSISKIPLRNKSGDIIGMLGLVNDITEHKLAEESKEQENVLLRTLIDNLPNSVFVKDKNYRKTVANAEHVRGVAAHLKLLGFEPPTDIIGKTDFEVYPKELAEKFFEEDKKVIGEGMTILNKEEKTINRDGQESWSLISKIPIRSKDGSITGLVGIATDITSIKEKEEAVLRERILLRTLIDNLPYSVYVKDKDYRKVISNPIDVRLCGRSREEEVIGRTDFDFYPKEVAERFYEDDRLVIETGQPVFRREESIFDHEGKEHWLLTSKVPLRNAKGEVNGLVGVGIDITEQRKLDIALRQSESELRALFSSMKDVILVMDENGRFLKVMMTDESLLYKPGSEIIGKKLHEVFPKEQADLFLFVIRKTVASGKPQNVEYVLNIRGEERWRLATATKLADNSVLWVARDITELKLKEKEITESEKKYRELVENSLVGVFKMNLNGRITYANRAMAEMLGYFSPEELMSVNFLDLYVNEHERQKLITELRANGKTEKNREMKLITKSGTIKDVLISASLSDSTVSAMVKDITEIKVLQQQFIQAQKLEGLGNIAAGIAHDFNNILGIIIGYSELLQQSEYEKQKFERGMHAITKAADRGRALVKQLLTFARKTATNFSTLNVNDIVTELERLLSETFPKTIEIHTQLQEKLPSITGDSTQIHQVLLNLCVNARDAMPRGGRLSILTKVVDGHLLVSRHPDASASQYVVVEVSDTGVGMDNETLGHIFEPFFTTKEIGKGTGLGLAVVYGIVESHKGYVDVTSKLNEGTTFSVYFPAELHKEEQGATLEEGSSVAAGGIETVLIIEDEEMLRDLLRTILESRGYNVISARDGEEGIRLFDKNKDEVALVITDLGLPKLSGEEVVAAIREIDPDARFIISTGFIDPEIKKNLAKIGITSFVLKPYKPNEVIKQVRDVILGKERLS